MQLDYESTSALLLPNRNGDDGEYDDDGDDNDEYIIYLNLWMLMRQYCVFICSACNNFADKQQDIYVVSEQN